MVAHRWRKRTDADCEAFLSQIFARHRVPRLTAQISTDGNSLYRAALVKRSWNTWIEYGRVVKHGEENRLLAVIREKIFGNLVIDALRHCQPKET